MSDTSGRDRANGDDRNRSQRPGNAGNSSDRRPGQRSQQGGRYGTSRGGARDDRGGDRRDRGGYGRGRDNRRDDHRDDHRNNRRDDNRGSDRRDDRSGDRRDDRRGGYGRNGSGSGGSGRSGDGRPAQRRDDSRSGYSRGGDSRGGRSGGRYDNRRDDNRRDNDRRDNRGFDRDRGPDRRSDDRRGRDGGPRGDRPDRRRDDRPRHDRGGEGRFRDDHRDNRRRDDRQRDGGGRGGPRDRCGDRDDRDARDARGHGRSGPRAGAHGKPGRKPGSAPGQRGDDRSVGRELLSAPELPEGAEYSMLDSEAKRELRSLPKDFAETIGRHLVAAGMLLDTEPEAALAHARYAKRRASRIPVVREAAGLAAYHTGNWSEALTELRAVRRMTHSDAHIAVIADSERAMGRPERALDIAKETNTAALPKEIAVELKIVEAGARRDLGQLDAAVVTLQGEDLDPDRPQPWSVRLFYAYADNLAAAGRTDEAVRWFLHAAEVDGDVETDAADRAAELAGE